MTDITLNSCMPKFLSAEGVSAFCNLRSICNSQKEKTTKIYIPYQKRKKERKMKNVLDQLLGHCQAHISSTHALGNS